MTTSETTREAPRGAASQAKREAVLDAAVELFLAGGFDGTSMDAVAAHAGVAKTTVYAHFGDKVELFCAATERGGAAVDLDLDKAMLAATHDPEQRLTQIVFKVLEATTTQQFLAFSRVMVTEAVRRPELTKVVRSLGVPHIVELAARTLREDADLHGYVLPDPEAYAGLFIRMASSAVHIDALVDVGRDRDTAFLQAQAELTTNIFLRALRNRDAGKLPDVHVAHTRPSPHPEPASGAAPEIDSINSDEVGASGPGPRAVEIVLSDEERAELRRWARGEVAPRLANRAKVVLACGEGLSDAAVASRCGTGGMTVAKWRARFAEHRLAGLLDMPRPGRPTTDLVLSPGERAELTRRARDAASHTSALRSKIVLACADGADNKTAAAELRCSAATVSKWRARFLADRLDGLADQDRPGRPASITWDQVEDVLVSTSKSAPEDAARWSRASMAKKSGVSPSSVGRIWKEFGLEPHRTNGAEPSGDPLVADT
ncbi:helix-turn-helix domain-containing protein [Streptomyces hokutonensis]|uniref:helix-turn-helix domain-containing protein n=1 Tax=Streptomyces hokutonensis TaxID=1306990 RepID=UPI0003604A25|nr:helix-turn-helix domain-containing protein [Streptomyces hokutonensis]